MYGTTSAARNIVKELAIFTARRYARAVYAVVVCPFVRPSVCPSNNPRCDPSTRYRITDATFKKQEVTSVKQARRRKRDAGRAEQEAQLSQRDRATLYVSKFVLGFTRYDS